MKQYSAYWLDPTYGWMGSHRLSLTAAIFHCKESRRHTHDCPVAIVPDNTDPASYFILVEKFA